MLNIICPNVFGELRYNTKYYGYGEIDAKKISLSIRFHAILVCDSVIMGCIIVHQRVGTLQICPQYIYHKKMSVRTGGIIACKSNCCLIHPKIICILECILRDNFGNIISLK